MIAPLRRAQTLGDMRRGRRTMLRLVALAAMAMAICLGAAAAVAQQLSLDLGQGGGVTERALQLIVLEIKCS